MGLTLVRNGQINVTSDFDINSHKLINVATPTSSTDAATKGYVDGVAQGLKTKDACRVATTTNITLSGAQTIDGVSVVAGDRVLVKNQTTGSDNGIYVCAAGAWARSSDADVSSEVSEGMYTLISEGTTNSSTGWVLTTGGAIILGTTSLTFSQFNSASSYTAGTGITISSNVVGLSNITSGYIYVGNGSGVPTAVPMSGDVTISNAGATTVNNTSGSGFTKYGNFVVRETPSGSVNGSNVTFNLANTPVGGTEQVYQNGLLLDPGGSNDYTISSGTITFNNAPVTGDKIRVNYQK